MSKPKEPGFFVRSNGRDLNRYREAYFRNWSGEPAVGDACPRNLFFPHAMRAIKAATPDARFVVLCRDPVARLYSHWWDWATRGLDVDFAAFFEGEASHDLHETIPNNQRFRSLKENARFLLNTGYATECGRYARNLRLSFDLFGRDRFHIMTFEDFVSRPAEEFAKVRAFLGLPPVADLKTGKKRNEARTLEGAVRPKMDPAVERAVADFYANDTAQLETMLSRSLPWKSHRE